MADKVKVGPLGEELVVRFLMKRGFKILDRNFRRKWGELDVVAEQNGNIHFIEVKAFQHNDALYGVSTETHDSLRPEDNVHPQKLKRLGRAVQTYLMARHVSDETPWQFDVVTVHINTHTKQARVKLLEDLVL